MARRPKSPESFTGVYKPDQQAHGTFDKGAIIEQKMIGFAGEGSAIHRIGPIYFWSWAKSLKASAAIEMHPHRGFEILTYVLEGALLHSDTLGFQSRAAAGDMQVMKTGSGFEHEEIFSETPSQSFQIWLDPHFREAILQTPSYEHFPAAVFPYLSEQNSRSKILIGPGSPIQLTTPAMDMQDLSLPKGSSWQRPVKAHRGWSGVVLQGKGTLQVGEIVLPFQEWDYCVHQDVEEKLITITANEELRLVWIEAPLETGYPFFPKPR